MNNFRTTVSLNVSSSDVAVLTCLHKTAFPGCTDYVI